MPFAKLHKYWDALVKELKELKSRVAQVEARFDQLNQVAPPTEEAAPKKKEKPVKDEVVEV